MIKHDYAQQPHEKPRHTVKDAAQITIGVALFTILVTVDWVEFRVWLFG